MKHGQTHGRVTVHSLDRKRGVCGRRESEGGLGLCLDKLSCDLDTELTTKLRLRALKST